MTHPTVAVAFEYPSVHGGERSFLAVAERLRDRFALVALAPPDGPLAEVLHDAGLPLVGCDVKDAASLHAALEEVRPALLHGNSLSVGRVLGRMREDLPCPATAHLRDILNLSKRAMRDLGRCDALVAVSAATRDHHVARGLPAERACVVHNGIDPQAFRFDVTREAARRSVREELNAPADAPLLLTIGQIGLRKGWDTLADAVGLLRTNRRSDPPPHVVAIGERWSRKAESVQFEEDVFATLRRHAPGRVHKLGTRSDVPRWMAAADLLVHPARQEPFGRVLLEAAAAGLPIVATTVGGTREMLGDAFAPVAPDDAPALATTIDRLLNDEPRRTRLAAAARERVERFPVARSAAGLAEIWERVLARRAP